MRSKLALGSLFLLFLSSSRATIFFLFFPSFFPFLSLFFSFLFLSFILHYINQLPYHYAWIHQAFITDDTIFSIAPATTSHYTLSLILLFFLSLSLPPSINFTTTTSSHMKFSWLPWFVPNWCLSWFVSSWCSLIEGVINKIYNLLHHELG